MCRGTPHTWELYMRGWNIKRKNEVYMTFWVKDEIRHLGVSEYYFKMIRTDVQ